MKPEVELKGCDILEVEERAYTTAKGAAATYRGVMFKYGGKVFKMGCESELQLTKVRSKEGKKADITLSMSTFGASIEPSFRILDVA